MSIVSVSDSSQADVCGLCYSKGHKVILFVAVVYVDICGLCFHSCHVAVWVLCSYLKPSLWAIQLLRTMMVSVAPPVAEAKLIIEVNNLCNKVNLFKGLDYPYSLSAWCELLYFQFFFN